MRPRLAQLLAEQVAPFCGQPATGDTVDLYPGSIFQAALCHDHMHMGFETEVAPESMDDCDQTHAHVGIEVALASCAVESSVFIRALYPCATILTPYGHSAHPT